MPTILRHSAYRVFFYSNEGDPREPLHVHVRSSGKEAKVWMEPRVAIAESRGFNSHELATIVSMIETNKALIEQAWHDHFGE